MKLLKRHLKRSKFSFFSSFSSTIIWLFRVLHWLNYIWKDFNFLQVVKLLAYISDKDLFAEFYRYFVIHFWAVLTVLNLMHFLMLLLIYDVRKKLARRLLFDKSANDDHERSILTKLKQQCGGQFTSKMEGMVCYIACISSFSILVWSVLILILINFVQVTDLTLARENQASFEDYLSNNPQVNPGIDLTVTVLTTGFWPSYKSFDLNLPAEMVMNVFLLWSFEI